MKNWLSNLLLFLCLSGLVACNNNNNNEDVLLARVGDNRLFKTELEGLIEEGTSATDSINLVSQYIDSWVRSRSFIDQAKSYLNLTQITTVEDQVEQYRESLLSYQFENAAMVSELDSIITLDEVQEYYDNNTAEFELAEPIIKGIFIKTDSLINKRDSLVIWLNDYVKTNNDAELRSYCSYYAIECHLNAEEWRSESQWVETLQLSDSNNLYKGNTVKVLDNGKYKYLYYLLETQKSGRAPVVFVEQDIRDRILRARKIEFVKDLKRKIYEKALDRGEIEIYE